MSMFWVREWECHRVGVLTEFPLQCLLLNFFFKWMCVLMCVRVLQLDSCSVTDHPAAVKKFLKVHKCTDLASTSLNVLVTSKHVLNTPSWYFLNMRTSVVGGVSECMPVKGWPGQCVLVGFLWPCFVLNTCFLPTTYIRESAEQELVQWLWSLWIIQCTLWLVIHTCTVRKKEHVSGIYLCISWWNYLRSKLTLCESIK